MIKKNNPFHYYHPRNSFQNTSMSMSEKDICSQEVWLPARKRCDHRKKKCKQELQILRAVCDTDRGASEWSSLWEGPAVPASLGVAFKVSPLAGASFVLSQRPLDRGRPIFGSKESCLPRSVLHLSKEQKSSWRGQCWVSLPRSFQLFQIPGFTSVT